MSDRNIEEEEIVEEEYYEEEVIEEVVEDDTGTGEEFEDQVVEPWIGRNSEPENYQLAVLALIAVLYKDDDTTDIANMMTRTPLPELYKYLKQQYWYKMHTDKVAKEEAVAATAEAQQGPAAALSVDEVLKIRMKGLGVTTDNSEEVEEEVVEEEEEEVVEEEVIDDGLAVIGEDEPLETTQEVEEEEVEEEILEESFDDIQKVRRRESQDDYTTEEEVVSADNSVASDGEGEEYEEQVIERWVSHDEEPEDMEAAVAGLITVVYKDDDEVDVESMVRRSSLPELYRYLKQQYWYKVHTDAEEAAAAAKELGEEEENKQEEPSGLERNSMSKRMSVDDMVANRLHGLEKEFSARAVQEGLDEIEEFAEPALDEIREAGESQELEGCEC